MERRRATPNTPPTAASGAPATDGRSPSLWFGAPTDDQDRRPQLTRERVVEEALTVIAHDGANALTMRRLAARLGVVPGALYNHVRNKQQLHDLLLDGVLAEVDLDLDPALGWTDQLKILAHRLRQVLEAHPGVAAILKTRDQRFTAGLDVLIDGLEHARNATHRPAPKRRPTTPRGRQRSQQTTNGDTQRRGTLGLPRFLGGSVIWRRQVKPGRQRPCWCSTPPRTRRGSASQACAGCDAGCTSRRSSGPGQAQPPLWCGSWCGRRVETGISSTRRMGSTP